MRLFTQQRGFTLIELLVVIAIIGVLSSVVLVSLSEARTRAKVTTAKLELEQFSTALVSAQIQAGHTLTEITSKGCSECACRNGIDTRNIKKDHVCYLNMEHVFQEINEASGGMLENYIDNFRDPWGSPYMLDENEFEWSHNPCRLDRIFSHGPNGVRAGGDDISMRIPFTTGECIEY